MIQTMTNEQLEQRLGWLENMMSAERSTSTLAVLNRCYQQIIEELADRDVAADEPPAC